jgi:glycerol-3-phosphate dehydrogenase
VVRDAERARDATPPCAGTSGRSTKLIHGGIRYLEQAIKSLDISKYELVEEALAERAHLLNAAPYMAHPVPVMIPLYKWWEVPYMYAGAKMYDLIAGSRRAVPASHIIWRVRERCVPHRCGLCHVIMCRTRPCTASRCSILRG